MPKVAYSEEDRRRVREELLTTALKLMSTQGIQHTTVEQVYRSVGISRSFFYAFFPTKEDLIVEALYLQQPRLLEYARSRDSTSRYCVANALSLPFEGKSFSHVLSITAVCFTSDWKVS